MPKYKKKEYPEIGTTLYCVYMTYIDDKMSGGKIIPCRVKSYQNIQGEIHPVLTEIGNSRREVSPTTHYIYEDVRDAIAAIDTKNK